MTHATLDFERSTASIVSPKEIPPGNSLEPIPGFCRSTVKYPVVHGFAPPQLHIRVPRPRRGSGHHVHRQRTAFHPFNRVVHPKSVTTSHTSSSEQGQISVRHNYKRDYFSFCFLWWVRKAGMATTGYGERTISTPETADPN